MTDNISYQDQNQERLKLFMSEKNLPIFDEINLDGTIQRYSSRNNSQKSEWYSGKEIAPHKYICTFASWRWPDEKHTWRSYDQKELPNENELIEEMRELVAKASVENQDKAIKVARDLWETSETCLKHPYLQKKTIHPLNLRVNNEILLIPLYNLEDQLVSLLKIHTNGDKRYFQGVSTKGLFHPFGDYAKAKEIVFCEGYATGFSINMSLGLPVISCGSANNVCLVAVALQHRYPKATLLLAQDNDAAGDKVALDWKKYVNENVYKPKVAGDDFNDMMAKEGPGEIKKLFFKDIMGSSLIKFLKLNIEPMFFYNKLLAKGTINVLYAKAKVGKSRFAYEMAFALPLGLDAFTFSTNNKAKVLYVDGELSDQEIQSRFQSSVDRLAKVNPSIDYPSEGLSIIKYGDFKEALDEKINLASHKQQQALDRVIKKHDLIIFDSYGCIIKPTEGESYKLDQQDWKGFFEWIRDWRDRGKTFLIIMHSTKSGGLAGTQIIKNDVDNLYRLSKPEVKDSHAACHMVFEFEDCRNIPQYDQQTFEAKLLDRDPRNNKSLGWECNTLY